MSSADQDWSEAIKASIENAESPAHCASSSIRQDTLADFLPTSSQSPGNSPQTSSGGQKIHLSKAQKHAVSCTSSQDQHISQSCTLNSSQSCEQTSNSEKPSNFESESQQQHCPAPQQITNKLTPLRLTESSSSINYPMSKSQTHPQEFPTKNQPQSQGGSVNSSQTDKNLSTVVPSFSTRHPQNQYSDHHQVRLSTPNQSSQQRAPLNASNAPHHLPAARMISSPRQANIQQIRQNVPHQIQHHQPFIGGSRPQQRMPHQQQQRPLHPSSSGAANMHPSKKMTPPGFTASTIRPHNKMPLSNHPGHPGQAQGARPVNQTQTSVSMTGQAMQPPTPKNISGVNKITHGHPQAFSNSQQVAPHHLQNIESDERMPQGIRMPYQGFEDEAMYYDEDEDDDEEMDDMDEEEMRYSGFHGNLDYGYPSSDSDELSEEESALLEELRCCEDDVRYEEIVGRLREKGVDPEEIEEMLYHSNYPEEMYHGENYDDDEDEDGDSEETVSSSSQGQTSYTQNQIRPPAQTFLSGGQNQSRIYPTPQIGQNQKETSTSSSMLGQQVTTVPSSGLNHQGTSHSIASVSTDAVSQQGKVPGFQTLPGQVQQKVSDSFPLASPQTGAQALQFQQQSGMKIMGQGSQQKKVFQNSTAEASQSTSQTSGWQPLPNVVKAQSPLRPGDPRQSGPRTIPQPGHFQGSRASLMNRLPQSHSQAQDQIGAPRSQNSTQSNPSGILVRPVQHLTIMTNNNQASLPGQVGQNRPLIVRQTAPVQQLVISSVPNNQQVGSVGIPLQTPPVVRNACPRTPLQVNQKPQGMPENPVQSSGQSQGSCRPVTPGNQSVLHQQSMIPSPRLKAVLEKDTAPSEASLARLNVMYMQQSLDQAIKAKKGTPSAQGQLAGPQNPNSQNLNVQNRFPSPQNVNQFPNSQALHLQKPHNPTFPAYQPKHQLPPRQPIPAIVNPNSSTNQTLSDGRPICSVVPFTSQNSGQAIPTNVQKQNTPQQNSLVRPPNPSPLSPPNISNSPQPSPGMLQNRMSMPAVTNSASSSSSSVGSNMVDNRSVAQGNMAPLVSNQTVPQQSAPDQIQQHQQPQVSNFKSETFSLDHLSEDKCIITGKGKQQGLTVNMVYQIRSPKDNSLVLALWNGERFEDLKQSDMKALGHSGQVTLSGSQPIQKPASDIVKAQAPHVQAMETSETDRKEESSSAVLGGTSKFQAEFMQSLTQNNDEDEQSFSDTESQPYPGYSASNELGQAPDFRMQKNTADVSSNQSTYIKPLPQLQPQPKTEEDDDDDSVFKKPFNENEDYFRVCQYCGYTSKNFKRCEGCKRVFQGEVKIHSLKKFPTKTATPETMINAPNPKPSGSPAKKNLGRRKAAAGQELSDGSIGENSNGRGRGRGARGKSGRTRGGGLRNRMGVKGTPGENFESSDSDESLVDRKRNTDGSGSSSDGSGKRRPARSKSKNPTPRKRSKKTDEPVTVTISSDEDEPSSTSNNMSIHAPSPAHSAGSESPIFPSMPTEPINAFGRFRRALMEDEEGHSKLSKKIQQHFETPLMDRLDEDEEEEENDEDDDEPPTYEIDIRSVRIGSMRTQPEGPLLINLHGVCFKVRSERTEEAFECEILAQDVEQVKFFSGQTQPVLFLFLTPESGESLRGICHMEPGDDEYFDPSSTDMKQKMVVIIIECFNYMPHEMLRETLSLWADMNHVEDECFIEELTEESANDLLIQSAPPVLTADVERDVVKFKQRYLRDANNMSSGRRMPGSPSDSTDNEPDSTSSSPPEIRHFFGTSVRLLQYPPPPARGIPITTEDLFCLTEGEFLNDVIIDFYLQYLYQEKLTEENKRRTHIFSSFFYKRLTQRDRHSEKTEEDAKKTVSERRHARVKKWTKTVDLFSKDFIIVPINEHSHWYLALICFPGLANSEVVPFIPSDAHRGDFEDESNDNGEERTNEDNNSHDSLPKTILGQQLNAKQCLDNEDSKYNIGQKQPCILVFDSLAGPSRTPNIKMLKEYLQCEWNVKKSEPRSIAKILRGSTPKVPQQSNYSDCGVYLLQYVESFFEDPIADFQIPMKGLQNWFAEELVHNKRRDIHDLIMSLHRRYQEERGDPRILDIKFESTPREQPLKIPPNAEFNSRSEEGMYPGFSRDDESSNSSMSGDMYKAEMASVGMNMENNLFSRAHGQLSSEHGCERQKDDDDQYGSEDQDDCEDNVEKQRAGHVYEHE